MAFLPLRQQSDRQLPSILVRRAKDRFSQSVVSSRHIADTVPTGAGASSSRSRSPEPQSGDRLERKENRYPDKVGASVILHLHRSLPQPWLGARRLLLNLRCLRP